MVLQKIKTIDAKFIGLRTTVRKHPSQSPMERIERVSKVIDVHRSNNRHRRRLLETYANKKALRKNRIDDSFPNCLKFLLILYCKNRTKRGVFPVQSTLRSPQAPPGSPTRRFFIHTESEFSRFRPRFFSRNKHHTKRGTRTPTPFGTGS